MKNFIGVFVLFACIASACPQQQPESNSSRPIMATAPKPLALNTPVDSNEILLRRYLVEGIPVSADGSVPNILRRMGDGAAKSIFRVIGTNPPDATEISNALFIVRQAFSRPSVIYRNWNREPRATLFLLKYLDSCTSDEEIKTKISDVRKFVQELPTS